MPSLKSRLIAIILKHTRKKAFSSPENLHRWIEWARRTQSYEPPATLRSHLTISKHMLDGFPVYEIAPQAEQHRQILYLHGGAYVFEITSYHWALIEELATRLGFGVTVPIYPIAPEHDFHAMFGMVERIYRQMLSRTSPQDIAFVGDSAGGNMAVVLTMMASEHGLPPPGAHVLISPGLDVSLANPETVAAERDDPWLGIPGGKEAIRLYSAGIDSSDWRISPIYGNLSILPRTLLLTGSRDMLTPDNLIFARKARAAGVEVEVVHENGMFHVWPLVNMPEARRARDRMVRFLSEPARFAKHVERRPDMIRRSFDGRTGVG